MPRVIRHHAGYFALAVTSLGLTVGATLVVFQIVNALWLKPLPFPDADRLVILMTDTSGSNESMWIGGLEAAERWTAFEAVAGQVVTSARFSSLQPRVVFDRVGRDVETLGVSSGYFSLLGQPIRGRDFTRADNHHGAEPVAIISDRLWSSAFERGAGMIGTIVPAEPFPIRIIGVAPPGFEGARRGERADVWIPGNLVPRMASGASAIAENALPTMVFARLRRGDSPAAAKRRLVDAALNERDGHFLERVHVVHIGQVFGTPDSRTIVVGEQRAGSVVAGLASLVLIGGCATIMALVLVHYERRRQELAIRIALGASRTRLAAELSADLAWVGAGGTLVAVLVAVWGLHALPALSLPGGVDLSRLDLAIDWRVLAVGVLVSILSLTAASLIPLTRATRASMANTIGGRNATAPKSSQRLRQVLLAVHVAATVVVLVAAGLFVRAVIYGYSAGSGFDIGRTAYVQVQVVPPFVTSGTSKEAEDAVFASREAVLAQSTQRLTEGLRSLPGVDHVALGLPPIGPDQAMLVLNPKIVDTNGVRRELRLGVMSGSPELLQTLGVPIIKGRALIPDDAGGHPRPAVVTTSLAQILWPTDEPLGQVMSLGPRQGTYTVVGIAQDFVYGSLTQASAGVVTFVRSIGFGMEVPFVLRTEYPDSLVDPIRKLIRSIIPDAPRLVISTGHEIVARDLGRERLGAWFFSGFGLIALVLGSAGVFGLVAYLAESRRREFGVRLALGGTPRDLVWRGVAAGLTPVSIGVAAGLITAAFVSRVFLSLLPGLSPVDASTYTGVAILLVGCAAAAALTAAWRLRRIEPAEALRAE
jgi:putative ABC transport system permease protein